MWYGKQASPASSTSTVDQQEVIFDDKLTYQPQPQPTNDIPASNTVVAPTTGRRQNATRAPKRPRVTNSRNAKVNGTANTNGRNNNANCNSKCSPPKRPKLFSLPQQLTPWKSLQHHFLRHTDVKYRPEKRMTMAELGNEVSQRRNGWKVHHLVGQLTDLIQNEMQNRGKVNSLLELFIEEGAKQIHNLADNCHKLPEQYATLLQSQRSYGKNEFKPELIVTKVDDLLRGDLQRSNMFDDQLRDCRDLIVRITNEHRDRVGRITTKFNKRIQL